MRALRVVVGQLEPPLLNESLVALLVRQPELEVMTSGIKSTADLLSTATRYRADVAIYCPQRLDAFQVGLELLCALPAIIPIGVEPNGRFLVIHVANIGAEDLISVVQALRRRRKKKVSSTQSGAA